MSASDFTQCRGCASPACIYNSACLFPKAPRLPTISLPFPPSSLSGHAKGHWRGKAAATKKYREWARLATLAARPTVLDQGDIGLLVRFIPPNRRSDRANFPVRMKAYFDGIADGLGVNDRRFVPAYEFCDPAPKAARVEVTIGVVQERGA